MKVQDRENDFRGCFGRKLLELLRSVKNARVQIRRISRVPRNVILGMRFAYPRMTPEGARVDVKGGAPLTRRAARRGTGGPESRRREIVHFH